MCPNPIIKKMKSYFIDAVNHIIEPIELEAGKVLPQTYAKIGRGCNLVQIGHYLTETEVIMVDEDIYGKENIGAFYVKGATVLFGNAVIWNCDERGESCDCESTMEDLLKKIFFLDTPTANMCQERYLDNPAVKFTVLTENEQ